MKNLIAVLSVLLVSGCATVPQEPPITVSIDAPVATVQFQLEDIIRQRVPASQVTSQTDNMMVISNDCMNVPDMDAFKCSMVMMNIGNTGWSGPFHIQTYRFAEINGRTSVRGQWNWCAINGFGKENCMTINGAGSNSALRMLENQFIGGEKK